MNIKLCKRFKYRVDCDDDLNSICAKFNTCKENILRNNFNIPLYVGEWIEITVNDYVTHIVKPAETIIDVACRFNITVDKLKQDNNLTTDKLYIGQLIKIFK